MSKKKKVILLSSMIVLLVVTAVFNFLLTSNTGKDDSAVLTSANIFTQYRTERATSRNEEILQLNAIIEKADVTSEAKESALKMQQDLTAIMEQELLLESLIKANGFNDVFVIIGLESKNVNVIVKDEDLTQDEAVSIYTVLLEENKTNYTNVKIIPIS